MHLNALGEFVNFSFFFFCFFFFFSFFFLHSSTELRKDDFARNILVELDRSNTME